VIFAVTKIEPPRTPVFTEIKERVTTDFKSQRGFELLQRKTKELADRAHVEHDLAKAAKEAGATVLTSNLVDRTLQVPQIGPLNGQASVAFTLKQGEISGPLQVEQGKKGVVLAVIDRKEPSLTDAQFTRERDGLLEQLSQQKREEALGLFMSNLDNRLKKEGKLKRNEAELSNLTKSPS
jgi:peptidyl-prolyl cis-trans isomerase D